jgi:large subunit ribosomal protein L15
LETAKLQNVVVDKVSESAKAKIEKAGGSVKIAEASAEEAK